MIELSSQITAFIVKMQLRQLNKNIPLNKFSNRHKLSEVPTMRIKWFHKGKQVLKIIFIFIHSKKQKISINFHASIQNSQMPTTKKNVSIFPFAETKCSPYSEFFCYLQLLLGLQIFGIRTLVHCLIPYFLSQMHARAFCTSSSTVLRMS